ncbi:MAG: Crp/Fnr family transcriptional regulator [Sphingomonas sp.]|nr:MAG: Crp/Fnr family transcriptional regulator [Sphingomonas sp.]
MSNQFAVKLQGFVDLSPAAVAAIEQATALPMRYAARQDIIREGDDTGPVFVVLDGWLCRYKILPTGTRQITAFLMPGDACDLHIGMLEQMDHSIQALTPALVAAIPRGTMDRLMADHEDIARAMYIAQLVDEATLRAWIVSMGRRSSIERVAHLICELFLRAKQRGFASGEEFELPLSQIVLADALGMTPVHINRVMRDLRDAGTLRLGRGRIGIVGIGKLIQIAGFDENYLHRRLQGGRPS